MINKIDYDIQDGRLGGSAGFNAGRFAIIGVSEIYDGQIKSLSDFSKVDALFGEGPLRDALEQCFSLKKKPEVYALSLQGTTPGTISGTTSGTDILATPKTGNTGTGTIKITGSPRNEYDIKIVIVKTGALNAGQFKVFIDDKEYKAVTIPDNPGTYALYNTGLTLTFAGSFTETDEYSFSTIEPKCTNAELLDAIDYLITSKSDFTFIVVTGITNNAFWNSFNTRLMMEEAKNNYIFGICQARYIGKNETLDGWVNALTGSERGNFSAKRLVVCAGFALEADLNAQNDIRPVIGKLAGHIAAVCMVQERPGKVKLEAVGGITEMYPREIIAGKEFKLNDSHISALDDAGYTVLCSYKKKKGLFFTRGRMFTDLTSDFKCIPERRVMDKALSLVFEKQTEFLNDDVEVGADGSPAGLGYFKKYSEMPLEQMKRDKEISFFNLVIPAGQNILSDETLRFELAITPKGYIGIIKGTIYYNNPALAVEE